MTKSAKESVLGLLFLMGVGTVIGIAGTSDRETAEANIYTKAAVVFETDGAVTSFMDAKGGVWEADNGVYTLGASVTLVIDDKGTPATSDDTVVFVERR